MKNQYIRGIAQKGGLGQFADLREGAWQERGVIPQCTLCVRESLFDEAASFYSLQLY